MSFKLEPMLLNFMGQTGYQRLPTSIQIRGINQAGRRRAGRSRWWCPWGWRTPPGRTRSTGDLEKTGDKLDRISFTFDLFLAPNTPAFQIKLCSFYCWFGGMNQILMILYQQHFKFLLSFYRNQGTKATYNRRPRLPIRISYIDEFREQPFRSNFCCNEWKS